MDILPKLLYVYQTIPIMIAKSFFASLCSIVIRFMWNEGLPRVKHKLLTLLRLMGGACLPDYETCYKATYMARILEWFPLPLPEGFSHDRTGLGSCGPPSSSLGIPQWPGPSTCFLTTLTCLSDSGTTEVYTPLCPPTRPHSPLCLTTPLSHKAWERPL